ncbi:carboxypeptidase-like regulatory domain-containing protein [Pedobacter sp. UC225_65]|uniref:carboxypeptidase-like regulatory domain-containing protein n=1 Tax=Pedobacter sp. UC225_65 TaxID=3350173 RepID=UPI00366C29BB
MKNFIQKSILIALLFVSYSAAAQTKGTVTGKVLSSKDKSAVEFASVAIKKLYGDSSVVGSGITGKTGSFSVSDVPVGKYRLFLAFLGLKSVTKDFELTAAQPGSTLAI